MPASPYFFESGLLKVRPYFQTKKINCKERWFNKTVEEVLLGEFRGVRGGDKLSNDSSVSEPLRAATVPSPDSISAAESHQRAMLRGDVTLIKGAKTEQKPSASTSATARSHVEHITGAQVAGRQIQNGDVLEYKLHIHEPPVAVTPLLARLVVNSASGGSGNQVFTGLGAGAWPSAAALHGFVLYDTNDTLVINKPAGIPIHPTGRYFHNSLTSLLEVGLGYKVYASHRLDRLTSGILVLGKSSQSASRLAKRLREKTVKKEYLALVTGKFPQSLCNESNTQLSLPLKPYASLDPNTSKMTCSLPIFSTIFTSGAAKFVTDLLSPGSLKPALTDFELVFYNPNTNQSLVKCVPHTGRTHQIRKHLSYIGFPIVNDPVYVDTEFAKLATLVSECIIAEDTPNVGGIEIVVDEEALSKIKVSFTKIADKMTDGMIAKQTSKLCESCGMPEFDDPDPESLILCLHAHTYSDSEGNEFSYTAPEPDWAKTCHI